VFERGWRVGTRVDGEKLGTVVAFVGATVGI
jgi:hypothetical protein